MKARNKKVRRNERQNKKTPQISPGRGQRGLAVGLPKPSPTK